MLDLCALRTSNPSQLPQNLDSKIFQDNIHKIREYLEKYKQADVLLAYGNNVAMERPYLKESLQYLCPILKDRNLLILVKTSAGHPAQPPWKMGIKT